MNAPRLQVRDVPPRAAFALEQAGAHPLLAQLLAARGVREAAELDDALTQLLPPAGLRGAEAAARLLADTLTARQRLCVVADYDCDGATACAVLLRGLRLLGAAPETLHYVVPDRALHGYGLTPAIVDLALPKQPALLVTVDNGIASIAGVAACARAGHEGAGHRPPPAGQAGRYGATARGRGHRQPEPARLQLRQQGAGRGRRGVLRAAGDARRTARARRLRGRRATAAGCTARPGRAGHGGRRGQARRQQPAAGGAGAEAHPRWPAAARRGRAVPGGRARPEARLGLRLRLRARPAHQRRRPPVGHDAGHRMPAHRRCRTRAATGADAGRHQPPATRGGSWHAAAGRGRAGAPDAARGHAAAERAVAVRRAVPRRRGRHRRRPAEGPAAPPDLRVRARCRRIAEGLRAARSPASTCAMRST